MYLLRRPGLLVAQGSMSPAQPGPGRYQAALPGYIPTRQLPASPKQAGEAQPGKDPRSSVSSRAC